MLREPNSQLKDVQKRINERILQRLLLPLEVHGSRKGHSIKTFGEVHTGQSVVMRIDLKDFFPSIRPTRIYQLFSRLGCAPPVARLLTLLTTHQHQLPQGAPTSPSLANLMVVGSGLRTRLKKLAVTHRLNVGLYVDDIMMSGNIEPERLKKLLVRIVSECGFEINREKLGAHFSRRAHERQEGPGVVLNEKVNVRKDYVRRLRATLHACGVKGVGSQIPKGMTREGFRQRLFGQIGHVRWLNRPKGDRLLAEFMRIDWSDAEERRS